MPGIDKRELILAQLFSVLQSLEEIKTSWRNRGELPEADNCPAAILLDGTEKRVTEVKGYSIQQVPAGAFLLEPQVFVVLRKRDTLTNLTLDGQDAPIGPEISLWRIRVVRAVTNDETLLGLVGPNGQIFYDGMDTDMKTGSSMGSLGPHMQFFFGFNYVLDPGNI